MASPCPVWLLTESVSVHANPALFLLRSLVHCSLPLPQSSLTSAPYNEESACHLVFQNEMVPPEYPSLLFSPQPFPYLGICLFSINGYALGSWSQLPVGASIPGFCLVHPPLLTMSLYTTLELVFLPWLPLSVCGLSVRLTVEILSNPFPILSSLLLKPSLSPFFKFQLMSSVTFVRVYRNSRNSLGSVCLGIVS